MRSAAGTEAATLRDEFRRGATDVVVRLDGEHGLAGTIRLAVRGGLLRGTIVASDADVARRLEASLGSLRRALTERGFADSRLTVRTAAPGANGAPADSRPESHAEPDPRHARREHHETDAHQSPHTPDQRPRRRPPRPQAER